jgi:hypothetical protein
MHGEPVKQAQPTVLADEGLMLHEKRFDSSPWPFVLFACFALIAWGSDLAMFLLGLTVFLFLMYLFALWSYRHRLLYLSETGMLEVHSGMFFHAVPRNRYRASQFEHARLRIEYRYRVSKGEQYPNHRYHVELVPPVDSKAQPLHCGSSGSADTGLVHAIRVAGTLRLPLIVPPKVGPPARVEAETIAGMLRLLPREMNWWSDSRCLGLAAPNLAYFAVFAFFGEDTEAIVFLYGCALLVAVFHIMAFGVLPMLPRILGDAQFGESLLARFASMILAVPIALLIYWGAYNVLGGFMFTELLERAEIRSLPDALWYIRENRLWWPMLALATVYALSARFSYPDIEGEEGQPLRADSPLVGMIGFLLLLAVALHLRDIIAPSLGEAAGLALMFLILVVMKTAFDVWLRRSHLRRTAALGLRARLQIDVG